ncbi:hypothetical protein Tco_0606143, partial [Tanacetum coccineum]
DPIISTTIPLPHGASFRNIGNPNRPITSPGNVGNLNRVKDVFQTDNTNNTGYVLVYLDGLEPYLLEILENRPFVPKSLLSNSTNILIKPQKLWSPEDRRLANQDKRLESIIISCLPNDVMKTVIKCTTTRSMWNDLIIAHEGSSDTRDTKIVALRLKFNAFKALEGEKVQGTFTRLKILLNDLEDKCVSIPQAEDSDSDVEEDTRSNSEFLADLNAEFHDRALLANQKRSTKDQEELVQLKNPWTSLMKQYLSSKDEGVTTVKAFMAIAEDEQAVGKADARSGQWVEITMKRRGKRKETNSLKEIMFTTEEKSPTETAPKVTSNTGSECDNQEPLPPLPKLSGAESIGTSNDVIPLADLTQTSTVFDKTKQATKKESSVKAIKKKTQTKSPFVLGSSPDNKADSSTKQLFLTLMEEVRGLKEKIKPPSDNSAFVSQTWSSKSTKGKQKTIIINLLEDYYNQPKYSTCQSTDHLTKEHPEQVVVMKTLAKLKAQPSLASFSRKAPKIPKPFIPCKSIIMKIHGKIDYDVFKERSPDISYFHVFGCPVFIHNHKDHLEKFNENADGGFFLGYSPVAKSFRIFNIIRQEMEEIHHVIYNEDNRVITQTSTKGDEINFNENRSFPDDEFLVLRNPPQSTRNNDYLPYVPAFDPLSTNNIVIPDHVIPTTQDINSPDE